MVAHGNLAKTAGVGYVEQDAAAIAGADVAIVVFGSGGGELGLVDDFEIDVKGAEVGTKAVLVESVDRVLDPIDHDGVEVVVNGEPFAAD